MSLSSLRLPGNWRHVHLPSTLSTMEAARDMLHEERPEEFLLVTADHQSAGRGQHGTSWEAEAGANILFSFSFCPAGIPAARQFSLSEALALAVAETLDTRTGGISVKWPNDIYYKERKICGMLLEHRLQGSEIERTLTGVGLNVNQLRFASDAPNPVSLRQITGCEEDRAALLRTMLCAFERNFRLLQEGGFDTLHTRYMSRLYHGGAVFPFEDKDGRFCARISAVSPLGTICLTDTDGRGRSYAFKEMRFVTLPEDTVPGSTE